MTVNKVSPSNTPAPTPAKATPKPAVDFSKILASANPATEPSEVKKATSPAAALQSGDGNKATA